jgi:hypothetical protein
MSKSTGKRDREKPAKPCAACSVHTREARGGWSMIGFVFLFEGLGVMVTGESRWSVTTPENYSTSSWPACGL